MLLRAQARMPLNVIVISRNFWATSQKCGVAFCLPLPLGYRKRYPAHPMQPLTALIGIENDTQQSKVRTPNLHRYRKRYPAHEREHLTALIGIENETPK